METAATKATGYRRGAITPFGSTRRLAVICDASASGEISVGGGASGISIHLDVDDLVEVAAATVGDVMKPLD